LRSKFKGLAGSILLQVPFVFTMILNRFLLFNRASKRSGNRAAELTSAEISFLVGTLQKKQVFRNARRDWLDADPPAPLASG
jgi:hypothetical protein